jgi:hypothetical protein
MRMSSKTLSGPLYASLFQMLAERQRLYLQMLLRQLQGREMLAQLTPPCGAEQMLVGRSFVIYHYYQLTRAIAIWTQLGLAYLVHKSFIFLRVPLTAAVLPKVVRTLRSWGYNIGKKKPKRT